MKFKTNVINKILKLERNELSKKTDGDNDVMFFLNFSWLSMESILVCIKNQLMENQYLTTQRRKLFNWNVKGDWSNFNA
jgi:hypothetical protein